MSAATAPAPMPSTDETSLGTAPIPAAPYYDPAWFELEREAVFKRSWLQIGHLSEIAEPGSYIAREVEVARASVVIAHGSDGQVRAFHNVCTHRGTQLVEPNSSGKGLLSCRYHRWTFNLDGSLRGAPDFENFYVGKDQLGLRAIAVEVVAQLIFINFDPQPRQSLREVLGPLAEQMETLPVAKATTFSEYVYEIDGNWKLTYDNFQENYHLRFIHPRSGGGGAVGPDNPFGYPIRYGFVGENRTQTIWTNPAPQLSAGQKLAFGKLIPTLMQKGAMSSPYGREYFALFPNFFLIGTPAQHFSHVVMPISATKSRGVIRIYWIGDDGSASERFAREFSMASLRDVHSEDRVVIEAGQKGLNSGALDVLHFQKHEVLLRHLIHHVIARVSAYQQENLGAAA